MARGGINKALVQKARDALLARGEHPSIDAVRVELGNTGSKTTIQRYLKELSEVAAEGADRRELSDELGELVGRLAERLREEAEETLRTAQGAFAEERSRLLERLEQGRLEAERQQQRGAELELALAAEQDAHRELREHAQHLQVELARLDQLQRDQQLRLDEREAQIASLEDKHRHARDALEHYRASVKEQREQEQRRHEGQVQQLQVELRQAQQLLAVKQEDILQLNRANERLLGELRGIQRERDAQAAQVAQLERAQAERQAQLASLEASCAGLRERTDRLEQERTELRERLAEERDRHAAQSAQQRDAERAQQAALASAEAELRWLRSALAAAATAPATPADPER